MPEITLALIFSSFVAGLLMFLAPCTLPLVPAYLAFISGVGKEEANTANGRRKMIVNALAFTLGFTLVFTVFGIAAGFFGGFVATFRGVLTQVGGVLIIIFGAVMVGALRFAPLEKEYKISMSAFITLGKPTSAFLMGSIFALGWTPCVGPVLATVLLLATTSATVFSGGLLLFIFSLGLAIPFILTAVLYTKMSHVIMRYSVMAKSINIIGGLFLIAIGLLLLFDQFALLVEYGYYVFTQLGLSSLFNYL